MHDGVLYVSTAWSMVKAYDAKTGEKLWTDKTAAAVMAGPATYEIDGEQYIAVNVGYGGANAMIGGRFPRRPGRLYVYKVGGTVKAPEFAPFVPAPALDLTKLTASTGNAAHGGQLMGEWCLSCHIGGIFTPDLSRSPRIATPELFRDVVRNGALRPRGMANFSEWLSEQDVEDIRAALLGQAKAELAQAKSKILSRVVRSSERPMGRMQAIGMSWTYLGTYRSVDDELNAFEAVTTKSVRPCWVVVPQLGTCVPRATW